MPYCPYSNTFNNWRQETEQSNSYIRIMQASPNTPAVDVYANDILIAQNLTYKSFSPYSSVSPGNYNIKVYSTGQKTNPLIDTKTYIPANNVFNIAIIGMFPNISLLGIPEPNSSPNFGRSCIRFVHLSPNTPALDITANGTKIFSNVNYKDYTVYACMPAGEYTFQVYPAGGNDILLTISNVQLEPNRYYTIYAVGLTNGLPPLEAIVLSEPR